MTWITRLGQARREWIDETLTTLRDWPWFETALTLRNRFREDRLGLTAGSLTFTSLMALVPLLTVMLALFTAFPIFGRFRESLQRYFLLALVPDAIAKPVLQSLTQFASKANQIGALGLIVLLVTALALMLTIDRTLNNIWRVRKPRPLGQRVLVYWAALTLGPLLIGVSLSLTSYAVSMSRQWVGGMGTPTGSVRVWLETVQHLLVFVSLLGLYHYVPNTYVRWRHALAGALFAFAGYTLAKQALSAYLSSVDAYSAIYGAFAAVPIFLLWLYACWVVVLLGAVIAAYAPSLQMRVHREQRLPGHRFGVALAVLAHLAAARRVGTRGMPLMALAARMRMDPLALEPIVDELTAMDWLARADEEGEQRLMLLVDAEHEYAAPLVSAFLLDARDTRSAAFRDQAGISQMRLANLLPLV